MAYLEHYGTPHTGATPHSGRYPWGSGKEPYQGESWYGYVKELQDSGMTEKEISDFLGISTTTLRAYKSEAKNEERAAKAAQAMRLKEKGYSTNKVAQIMGLNESSVRALLQPSVLEHTNINKATRDALKDALEKYKYIDVSSGTEAYMGISKTRLNQAVRILEDEGYEVKYIQVEQLGTGHKTSIKVLCPSGTSYSYLANNPDLISPVTGKYSNDEGRTFLNIKPPVGIDPNRVGIRYAEQGGTNMDGVILVRPGVEDVSLGESRYAQVRIKVGDKHYLKGMAMYSDDLPDGVDLLFNTNKSDTGNKLDAMKSLKDDPDNPFGATIKRQREYVGPDGKMKLGVMNIVNEEGDWGEWKKTLSSQMLSKQPVSLVKKQLNAAYEDKLTEFNEIMSVTNPAVKKKLLEAFSDDCDSSAVHLKAKALPGQASKVILPFEKMSENEVYCPTLKDGETVVLIRYPHGGRFEIPELKVNNKFPAAKKALGDTVDAIGINHKVAERLSGADFDGDTVLVIPNSSGQVKTSPALKGLKDFEPKIMYKGYEGMPKVGASKKDGGDGFNTQVQMGKISNLITDMTIMAASQDEIARAVRHSMVVIDAEKHQLNWKQSEADNAIAELRRKYQGRASGGASTLISRAKSPAYVDQRKEEYKPDPITGEKRYRKTGESYINKEGKLVVKKTKSNKMTEAFLSGQDAFALSSGTPVETAYATYANKLKALGNRARKELLDTPLHKRDPSAARVYKSEVESLDEKLNVALRNAPLERQAQIQANVVVKLKLKDNPGMSGDEKGRLKAQALASARNRTGASKTRIKITPKEWTAIQAGAISNNKLIKIINNTDLDILKNYATPRSSTSLSSSQVARAKAMSSLGYTQAQIAEQLGVSASTISKAIRE